MVIMTKEKGIVSLFLVFLISSLNVAIATPRNIPSGKALGWYKNQEIFTESTTISSCQELSTPGETYILDSDILDHSGTCFTIPVTADNIILDCNGHTISGDGTGNGIEVSGSYSVVKNCSIENFLIGYKTGYCQNNQIEKSTISQNAVGVHTDFSQVTIVTGNFIIDNSYSGIELFDSGYVWIYNNFLNNTDNVNENTDNYWETIYDCSSGSNIIGDPCMGGNYWATPSGDGYSETCIDDDGDGICDTPYPIDGRMTDEDSYPLTEYIFPEVTITSPRQDRTYSSSSVLLRYIVNKPATCSYSLDEADPEPLPDCADTTLDNLEDGPHYVTVYVEDVVGNEASDEVNYFYVDTTTTTIPSWGIGGGDTPMFEVV